MCLSSIINFYPKKDKEEGIGYKVFVKNKKTSKYMCPVFGSATGHFPNKWIRRQICSVSLGDYNGTQSYDSGFHLFPRKKDAVKYKRELGHNSYIKKIKYKGRVCLGFQNTIENGKLLCIVAKQMMILEK